MFLFDEFGVSELQTVAETFVSETRHNETGQNRKTQTSEFTLLKYFLVHVF